MLQRGADAIRKRGRAGLVPLLLISGAVTLLAVSPASAVPDRALHGKVVVGKTGTGEGRVTSSPDGIDCGPNCSFNFISTNDPPAYQPVTLTATAEPGSVFEGFGDCGETSCTIDPVESGKTYEVTATFTRVRPSQLPLTLSVFGQGRVVSAPAGIDCGQVCSHSFAPDTAVTLTATPTPGWTFAGWGGACSGTEACQTTMSAPRSVTATFAPPGTVYTLAVATAGGDVGSDIPGIACGQACVATFGAGVEVTLTPSATPVSWSGACSGTGACVVPLARSRAVSASIGGAQPTAAPTAVTVTGSGAVTSAPAGIDCGKTCGALFPLGTPFTLRATPAAGWVFAGWTISCQGVEPTCRLPARGAASVAAAFVEAGTRYPVAVTKAGKGTVASASSALNCGSRCTAPFPAGEKATLRATPQKGWKFVRWSGDCRGRKPVCTLGMNGPKAVSATFGRPADHIAPKVRALPAAGVAGEPVRLRYRISDASARTRESATVYAGSKELVEIRGAMHALDPDTLYYFLTWQKAAAAASRFCVTSTDPTGNVSKPSCAPLRIS